MKTQLLQVDPQHPQPEIIAAAAAILRIGGVVAFPTETVYGLGADALNADAVAKIFAAKGRPSNNPLIVHVAEVAAAQELTSRWTPIADELVRRFWPGPLTIVLPKADCVPSIVTAGGPTVALRMPRHPIAQALIRASERPLAAPSANLSTRVSAVRASHVLGMLEGKIEMILDGGATPGGLESTVVDLSADEPRILRPGLLDAAELAEALGREVRIIGGSHDDEAPSLPSPGLLRKHYSPSIPLVLTGDDGTELVAQLAASGTRVGWLPLAPEGSVTNRRANPLVVCVPMPREPAAYAARLYDTLHALEAAGVGQIVVEAPPAGSAWEAVRDRLLRAAAT